VTPAAKGDVLGSGTIGSIDDLLTALEPYLTSMGAPNLSVAGIRATVGRWIGLASWDGVDGSRPARVWLLNPKKFRPPVVVALPMQKGKTAQMMGWSAEAVGDYALLAKNASTLAAVKGLIAPEVAAPAAVTGGKAHFSLALPDLLAVYADDVRRGLSKLGRLTAGGGSIGDSAKKMIGWFARAALDVASQIQRVEADVDLPKDHAHVTLRLLPQQGTGLAAFLAAPKQPTPEMLAKIPADAAIAFAISYAPEAIRKVIEHVVASMEAQGAEMPAEVVALIREVGMKFIDALRGDLTYVKKVTGGSSMLFIGAKDAKKALGAMRLASEKLSSVMGDVAGPMGIKTKSEFAKEAGSYKGVKYDRVRVTYDFGKVPDFQAKLIEKLLGKANDSYTAAAKDYLISASGTGTDAKSIQTAIDLLKSSAGGLADKAEFKELSAALPASRFAIGYFSFADWLKSTLSILPGPMVDKLTGIQSRGFIGGSLAVDNGALQIDVLATRSQLESVRMIFQMLKGASGMRGPGSGPDPSKLFGPPPKVK
jgi:hypothetical protein